MIDIGDLLAMAGLGLLGYSAWTLVGWAAVLGVVGAVLLLVGIVRQLPRTR